MTSHYMEEEGWHPFELYPHVVPSSEFHSGFATCKEPDYGDTALLATNNTAMAGGMCARSCVRD